MRTIALIAVATILSACATPLERQAGPAARDDCWQQAKEYVRANIATIANEWREHEKYKHYQACLSRQARSAS